jgi:hypothetical protein
MQMPERLMPAQDGGLALRTASKSAALRSFHRNHKTSPTAGPVWTASV